MEKLSNFSRKDDEQTIDPVCGMGVSAEKNRLIVNFQGTSYYFCGEGCRNAFEKDPANYLHMPTKKKGLWSRYLKKLEKATANGSIKCH